MRRLSLVMGILVSVASAAACGGSTEPAATTDRSDLPEDFDSVSTGLTAAVDPNHEACGDHDRDCRDPDGKPKHGHRLHHLFKRLDRLDGDKDHRIVIASLPTAVPQELVAKLHTIDADGDGVVTKKEARHAWKRHDGRGEQDDHDDAQREESAEDAR